MSVPSGSTNTESGTPPFHRGTSSSQWQVLSTSMLRVGVEHLDSLTDLPMNRCLSRHALASITTGSLSNSMPRMSLVPGSSVSLTYDLRVLPAVVAMCHCHGGRSFRRVVSSGGAFGFMQQCQCVRGSSRVSQPDALELYGAFSAVI